MYHELVCPRIGSIGSVPQWFKQLGREFWLPLVVAVAWVIYNIWVTRDHALTFVSVVTLFGPAFFLCSWAGAQYFRVKKQVRLETDLVNIQQRVAAMLGRLDETASDLTNRMTGGDSFCVARVSDIPTVPGRIAVLFNHFGKYSVHEVRASVRRIDEDAVTTVANFDTYRESVNEMNIGHLSPGQSQIQELQCPDTNNLSLQFNFYGRNGQWTQIVMARKVNGKWLQATRVERANNVISERIDAGYLGNGENSVTWPATRENTHEAILQTIQTTQVSQSAPEVPKPNGDHGG